MKRTLFAAQLLVPLALLQAADITLTGTLQLPVSHSIGWVRANASQRPEGLGWRAG